MALKMTNIYLFYINTWGGGRASIKRQRYFMEIYLSRGGLVPINYKNRGVTVFEAIYDLCQMI